jgi:hypothetical protein
MATLHHGSPLMIDFTPTAAVTAGDVLLPAAGATISVIAHRNIAANELGAVAYGSGTAVYKVENAGTAIAADAGDQICYTIANGQLVSPGTPAAATPLLGRLAQSVANTDEFAYVVHESS